MPVLVDKVLNRLGYIREPQPRRDRNQELLNRSLALAGSRYGAPYPPPPVTDTIELNGVHIPLGADMTAMVRRPAPAVHTGRKSFVPWRGKADPPQPPIINDGAGNLPSIRVTGSWGSWGMPAAFWTPRDYASQAWQGYQRNSDVYACVSLIANAAKQVKWWDGSGNTKSLLPEDVLAKSCNLLLGKSLFDDRVLYKAQLDPRKSIALLTISGGAEFIERWVSYILLSGNAYIEIDRTKRKLYLNNPAIVNAEVNRSALHQDEAVDRWRVSNGYGQQRWLQPFRDWQRAGDLVHSKLFHPLNPVYGMAPLEAAMLRVDMQNEGQTLMKRVLQRGFVPGWIESKPDVEWNDEQVSQLRENIKRSKFAGEELFLENAIWHPMGFEPQNAGLSDQQILTKRDIASVFHVDPALIGDTTARTYATYRESRRGLYMEAVIPLLTQFRDDWNRTIGAELQSPLDFDRDSFDAISAAREEATDRVHKLWTSGLITQNEGRRDLEYDVVKGGDVFYAPASFVPLAAGEPEDEEE